MTEAQNTTMGLYEHFLDCVENFNRLIPSLIDYENDERETYFSQHRKQWRQVGKSLDIVKSLFNRITEDIKNLSLNEHQDFQSLITDAIKQVESNTVILTDIHNEFNQFIVDKQARRIRSLKVQTGIVVMGIVIGGLIILFW